MDHRISVDKLQSTWRGYTEIIVIIMELVYLATPSTNLDSS
jgi:hypothetical protein